MKSNYAYEITNLSYNYSSGFKFYLPELKIGEREIIGVTGLNGSGKSTLLKLLGFLLTPINGSIKFFNTIVTMENQQQLRTQVTMLLQEPILLQRSVYKNMAYGLELRKQTNIHAIIEEALHRVDLPTQFLEKQFHQLSGGEAKRVTLATRIALNPKVLLLDEPTTNIDNRTKEILAETLLTLTRDKHTTIVASSHDEAWLHKLAARQLYLTS